MFHPLIVGVLREVYTSIIGDTVEELYRHEKFPNKPDISEVLSEFDATFNDTEGYGQRLSAFYHVSNGSLIYFTLQIVPGLAQNLIQRIILHFQTQHNNTASLLSVRPLAK